MMVSSNHQTSYANRAKQGNSASSSTSATDVEKPVDDGPVLNGVSNPPPNFWTVRKEQMAAKTSATVSSSRSTVVGTPSSSSSPTLVASPPLPSSVNIRSPSGVNLDDTSTWPDVSTAAAPSKDRDKGREKPSSSPFSTPKKNEKTKWIPIPPSELQAAADASPTKQRGHRASSVQSSPKLSSRGRRLPTDEAHDMSNTRRRSPSHLATHAYTHPFNSPTRQLTSLPITRPPPLPHTSPRQPPLVRQKRPVAPARSGPVAGYRDIDDLNVAEGRLVMFGSIGSGEERVLDTETCDAGSTQGRGKSGAGGIAIGVKPDELPRSAKAPAREIVDLTDGASIGGESKWEFGTSSDGHLTSSNQNYFTPSNHYLPHAQHALPHPSALPPPHLTAPPPDSIDPLEYDVSRVYYRDRGGRRGRGRGGRRGMPHQHQHYAPPLHIPERYPMQDRYAAPGPELFSPPGPIAGPDGYYMMPYYYPPYTPSGGPGVAPYPPPPSATSPYPPPPSATSPYPPPPPIPVPVPQSAPIPMPVTATPFPIDPMRWYLLGQIEYYFSIQNLVTDFWLRKQMDSHGWIPISTIASFNRIRQLTANTYDTMLVKDVMALSALVEVHDDWVRLRDRQWMPFVLPDAGSSKIGEPGEGTIINVDGTMQVEDEEEVVFVMEGNEDEQMS